MAARETSQRRGRPEPQPLFESKLHPPRSRPNLVSRTALVDRLIDGDTPITSVVAPPGYGKTTLLAQWADRTPSRVAWLSVDRHDNDPSQLLSYTAAALERVAPSDAMLMHPSVRTRSVAAAASEVAAAMARMKEPITLILDHVEALENEECLDTVAELALHLPPGARLALATRVDPPLPIPRLRASGDITEIGVADLAMNHDEAYDLLVRAGVELPEDALDRVIERTEGWPVGLYLAALAINAGGSRESAGIPFSGDDRLIAEYLRAELLDRLSDDDVAFLTRTAVLERLSPELCDAVLQVQDSRKVLESLAHSNLLLVPLDRQGEWYRYHHLFRDLLRAELIRREPELALTLHGRAAEWFEAHEWPELAIEHAQSAGDPERSNRLLLAYGPMFYASGRRAAAQRQLVWFEAHGTLEQYPALAILGAMLFCGTGREAEADRLADIVEGAVARAMPSSDPQLGERAALERLMPDGSTLAGWLAMMRVVLARDGVEGVLRDAQVAATELGPQSGYRGPLMTLEAIAHHISEPAMDVDGLLARACAFALESGRMPAAVAALAMRGLVAADRGEWNDAQVYADEVMNLVTDSDLIDYSESGLALALAARVADHRGDNAAARQFMTQGALLRPLLTYGRPLLSVPTLLEFGRNYAALGDAAGAREVIRQAREILKQRPRLGTLGKQLDALETKLDTIRTVRVGATSLTAAELRLVPFLPTHLTFPQVAERLNVSRNTAKSQAISIYQKLGVSSRGAAVQELGKLGLLDR